MRLNLTKAQAEELIAVLNKENSPLLKPILDYLEYRKDLPPLKK